jgi:hypothetical protein
MPKQMRRTRKRRSGGAEAIDPASVSAITAEGRQPSNAIMEWATTAGIPAPLNMQNVAHGGKRSTRRKHRKCGGKHRKHSGKRRTHRKHRKHSMKRTRKHRGGECGACALRP